MIKLIKLKIHKLIDVLIVDGGSKDGSIKALNFAKKYLIGIIIINNNTGLSKQLLAAYKISYKKYPQSVQSGPKVPKQPRSKNHYSI